MGLDQGLEDKVIHTLIFSSRNGALTTISFLKVHHPQNTSSYNNPTLPIITTGDGSFIY